MFDEDMMGLVGGWAHAFVLPVVRNRWYQRSQLLLATQMPVARRPRKEHLLGGRMIAIWEAVAHATKELREDLAAPSVLGEPEGLTLKANLSAPRGLLQEFIG